MDTDEKIILLGSLFREISKFERLCSTTGKNGKTTYCSGLVDTKKELLTKVLGIENDIEANITSYLEEFNNLITNPSTDGRKDTGLVAAIHRASRLAYGDDPVSNDHNDEIDPGFLTSIFHTISLLNTHPLPEKYLNQEVLSKAEFNLLNKLEIEASDDRSQQELPPDESNKLQNNSVKRYGENDYDNFIKELDTLLESFVKIDDFTTFYCLVLNLFEHYFWCLPVDSMPKHSGISLFNYAKDVAGLAHAIHLTKESKNLLLVNVELVGKVKYMSNISNTKPAKILRGRSIFVQVVTRIVVSILLKGLRLTEASVLMNAAGKVLIVAPGDSSSGIKELSKKIEATLKKNFLYEISFGIGVTEFPVVPDSNWSFGDVLEASNIQQQNNWQKLFYDDFFGQEDYSSFILPGDYYRPASDDESDKMKCRVTDMPIMVGRKREIRQKYYENDKWTETVMPVDLQVFNEFMIGDILPKQTILISVDEDKVEGWFNVRTPKRLKKFVENSESDDSPKFRIIINPSHEELMETLQTKPVLLKDASFITVANYVSLSKDDNDENIIMDFEMMTKQNKGGEFLTMIKGDIDNFGIILSCGLINHSISSHSTLSSQLKYFFSFGLNNLLSQLCSDSDQPDKKDRVVYSVYSGGDDLFLVTTQSYAIELVRDLNKKFTEFTCSNPEIHISYSFTNFKHNTPIRIISDFADYNQKAIKQKFKNTLPDNDSPLPLDFFLTQNDKAGSMIFDTPVKNDRLDEILDWVKLLSGWVEIEQEPPITKGSLRFIFDLAVTMAKYFNDRKSESLFWHPKLTYYVKRNINLKCESLTHEERQKFNKFILELLKIELTEGHDIKEIITPITSAVILRTRN